MTTPSQWNGQQRPDGQPNSPQNFAANAGQGTPDYGTPPSGPPSAYNGFGQAAQGQQQAYGQQAQQPAGYQQPAGGEYQQPGAYQEPGAYSQPGDYSQPGNTPPRRVLTFSTLREELSFATNRFGMISLASALGGWLLTTLLSFIMSAVARTGSFEIYAVLNPVLTILQILSAAAAIVFGVLALRASGWRNMPASVGSVLGVVMIVPAIFYFLFGLIPYSY
ncbi:hypothetical protein [Pseudoclavibacter sp. RFBB5]|uniref:hypothetical protein n=1 Tax=Pseudoclavibacter sp. RFBB5 TaxID=2080574 RepID=UPI000CE7C395|nr:hypothetical protein [Pseudoclavibacter sp. RFBB5]PPG32188.1 hypothetical protein C5B97_03800 [Pseudoclavibacter sp. RFBB5]